MGPDFGTVTAIVNRPGSRILRDVHKREVGAFWRDRADRGADLQDSPIVPGG